MSLESDDIRDLAEKVSRLAREHRAFSMVQEVFRNLDAHLTARVHMIEWRDLCRVKKLSDI